MSRKLHVDVGWLWAGYLGRALVYFGLTIVFTRALGADDFGELSLFLAITLGVSQVAGSWPFLAVPVLGAESPTIGSAFRPAAKVAAGATAITLLVALPIAFAVSSRAAISLLSMIGYAVALVALQGVYAVLQTAGRMRDIATVQNLERALALLIALPLAAAVGLTVHDAELLLACACLLTAALAYVWVGRRYELFGRNSGDDPDHLLATVLTAVGPMGIVSICAYGVAWIDIFILAAFKSNADVGVYSLAYQVFNFIIQLGSLWGVATLPRHARSTAAGEQLSAQLPRRRLIAATAGWAAVIAAVAIAAAIVLPHAFGVEFERSLPPLMVLFVGSGIYAAAYFLVIPALIAGRRTRLILSVSVLSVAINLLLDLALVPAIGVMGPAIATSAQAIVAAAVLGTVALGGGLTLVLFGVGTPAAAGIILLAVDRGLPALLVAATGALVSMALAGSLLGWWRGSAAPAGAEP